MNTYKLQAIRNWVYAIAVAITVLIGFQFSQAGAQPIRGRIEYQQDNYQVGPGDVLTLKVLHEPEYDQEDILVRPDGHASFVGVGELSVADQSLAEITRQVESNLRKTLVNPQVLITVKSTRPGIVYLSGAVLHPGMFQFSTNPADHNFKVESETPVIRTDMRLSNILASAGGVKASADLSNVTVTRAVSGEKISVNLWKVLKEGSINNDLWVYYGDNIHIPEAAQNAMSDADYELLLSSSIGPKGIPIRVIGQVKAPGIYYLDGTSPLLTSAIAKAGGFENAANKTMVAVGRFGGTKKFDTTYHNLKDTDLVLKPNDVVYVSENKAYIAGRFFQEAWKVLSPFQSAAMAGASASQIFGWGGWDRRRFTGN